MKKTVKRKRKYKAFLVDMFFNLFFILIKEKYPIDKTMPYLLEYFMVCIVLIELFSIRESVLIDHHYQVVLC